MLQKLVQARCDDVIVLGEAFQLIVTPQLKLLSEVVLWNWCGQALFAVRLVHKVDGPLHDISGDGNSASVVIFQPVMAMVHNNMKRNLTSSVWNRFWTWRGCVPHSWELHCTFKQAQNLVQHKLPKIINYQKLEWSVLFHCSWSTFLLLRDVKLFIFLGLRCVAVSYVVKQCFNRTALSHHTVFSYQNDQFIFTLYIIEIHQSIGAS